MEDFITYEQAKALKELGYEWKCTHYYDDNGTLTPSFEEISADGGHEYTISINNLAGNFNLQNGEDDEWCSAPTLAQAQKWLREKEIEVGVFAKYDGEIRTGKWMWLMRKFDTHLFDTIFSEDVSYDTYEEALSIGINQALELLKEKK